MSARPPSRPGPPDAPHPRASSFNKLDGNVETTDESNSGAIVGVDYRLLDFGDGRKLEQLGDYRIDRPSPAAEGAIRRRRADWNRVDARYDVAKRRWNFQSPFPDHMAARFDDLLLTLRAAPAGHIGCFPEQATNWQWLRQTSRFDSGSSSVTEGDALNLFAHTGGTTLALAATGHRVTHVDASRPSIDACRRNATINRLHDAPIRTIVDDAAKFAARELRRDHRYDTIVLDPPAYGHDPNGKAWRIQRDLWPLMDTLGRLRHDDRPTRLLWTGHSPDIGPREVLRYLRTSGRWPGVMEAESLPLNLTTADGRMLNAGHALRVIWR